MVQAVSKKNNIVGKKDSNESWSVVDRELIEYNSRQYMEMYRSTSFVISNLSKKIKTNESLNILDIGCGGGGNLFHIAKKFDNCNFTGVDINEYFINFAKKNYNAMGVKNVNFYECDIFSSKESVFSNKKNQKYDIVGSSQVLSFLDYDRAKEIVHKYFQTASKAVYFQSLFTDYKLDYQINIFDFTYNKVVPYNVYCISELEKTASLYNFQLTIKKEFVIDIDLCNNSLGRGTKTMKDEHGKRMMFTGDLYLPWHFLYFEKV